MFLGIHVFIILRDEGIVFLFVEMVQIILRYGRNFFTSNIKTGGQPGKTSILALSKVKKYSYSTNASEAQLCSNCMYINDSQRVVP